MLPQFFARRYLFSPKSRSVVNLISGLSVAAVAMPVAAMIVLLSVFNGFESLVKSMCSAFDADLTVSARQGQTFAADAVDTAALGVVLGVGATLLQQRFGLIEIPAETFLTKSYPVEFRPGDLAAVLAAFGAVACVISNITVRSMIKSNVKL